MTNKNSEKDFINNNSIFYKYEKKRLLSLIIIFFILFLTTIGSIVLFTLEILGTHVLFYLPFYFLTSFFFFFFLKNVFLLKLLYKKRYEENTKEFDLSLYYRWIKKNQIISIFFWIYIGLFLAISLSYNLYFSLVTNISPKIEIKVIESFWTIFIMSLLGFLVFKKLLKRDIIQGKLFFGSKIFRIEVEIVKKQAIKELVNSLLLILYIIFIIPIILAFSSKKLKKLMFV